MQREPHTSTHKGTHMPRFAVMVPTFYRGDRSVEFIWKKFCAQTYPNKKLFVCRNKYVKEGSSQFARNYLEARNAWRAKQAAHPQLLVYWEQEEPYQGLGHKRNLMLQEIVRPSHGADYICTMDDDDVYASTYLEAMYGHFKSDPKIHLVNFRDFLCIQTSGTPVALKNPVAEEDGALLQALEASRAYLQALPGQMPPESNSQHNKWHVHSRGAVLPAGFGFSFIFKASLIRDSHLDIHYGEDSQQRSGEEDVLYKLVKAQLGEHSIKDLSLSQGLEMAVHMENGQNISGDTSVFHFPMKHYVDVPRPLSFVPTEILEFLREHHPDESVKTWAATVCEVKSRQPLHRTMTFVANQRQTEIFAELWQRRSNWDFPWKSRSRWFVPPVGKNIPGGQDIPVAAHIPQSPWPIAEDRPAFEHRTQRSLVVVPGSHLEYESRAKKQLEILQEQSVTDKSITVPTGHGVKVWETWARDSAEVLEYEQRARQLDLRSVCRGTSCMLLWNSATLHQGTVSLKTGTPIEEDAFVPPLLMPCVFPVEATEAWRAHLEKEGYVVLRDILGENMDTYLGHLLEDINKINPEAKLQSLDEVQDLKHLGLPRRGLRYTLGFPHGKFAWAIRQHDTVRHIWKDLYQTHEVMGSTDVPALTRSEPDVTVADQETHDEWLHWDQNALLEPVGRQKMFQSMVYLFPDETNKLGGSTWERIAMVVCMVPTAYRRSVQSEKTLLALAITGEASNHWPQLGNANYGWNGMRMEQMKEKFPHLTEQQIEIEFSHRFISAQQMKENGWKRLSAELNPDVTERDLLRHITKLKGSKEHLRATREELKEFLCSADYQKLRDILDLEDLRRIVHPRVEDYVGFVADPSERRRIVDHPRPKNS